MKKKTMVAVFSACVLALAGMSGCGKETKGESQAVAESGKTAEESENAKEDPSLSGSIRMAGSTSMEKLANALAEGFMEKYQEVTVTAEFVGSGAGIEAVLSGSADIGNSSRNLKAEEKDGGAVENVVAIDGIAVCVDPQSPVTGLTKQQADIYTGVITNWSEAGGADAPIIVIGAKQAAVPEGHLKSCWG